MRQAAALLGLLVVSMAAGLWMFSGAGRVGDAPPAVVAANAPEACDEPDTCSAGLAVAPTTGGVAAAPQPPDAAAPDPVVPSTPSPPSALPAPSQPSTSTAPAMDAQRLREDADRFLAAGRVSEGVAALRRATELDPSARNHGDLGRLLEKLTTIDEALIHLRKAADLEPGNADRWIDLANAYYRKVDPGEAWKAERRARQAEPGLVLGRDAGGRTVRKSDSPAAKP